MNGKNVDLPGNNMLNRNICRCMGAALKEICERRETCARYLERKTAGSGGTTFHLCRWTTDKQFDDYYIKPFKEVL